MEPIDIKQIEKLSSSRQQDDLKLLRTWADINSGTHNLQGNQQMLQAIAKRFETLPGTGSIRSIESTDSSSKTESYKAYYHHICREQAPIKILLNGHVDTVFGPDHSFQHCDLLDSNTLRGPGVTDMKGGIVILLAALEIFEAITHTSSEIGWEIILTCDEEIGSTASRPILEAAAQRNHLGITFESSLPDQKLVRKRMGVGYAHAKVQGRSAHVGRNFDEGKNAIVKLSNWITQIHALNEKIPGAIINAGSITGGGPLNVVSEFAEAKFNLRVQDAKAEKKLFQALDSIHQSMTEEGYECSWSAQLNRKAKEAGPAFDTLFQAWKTAANQWGRSLEWRDTGGGSDGNILQAAGLPIIDNLGMVGDGIHSSNEYAVISSLTERTQLVTTFLLLLSNGSFNSITDGENFASKLKTLL